MKNIDELHLEWEKDSIIDSTKIGSELLKIPTLHSKYLRILNQNKLSSNKLKFEYDKMKHIKTEYFLGNLDKETLDKYNWDQFDLRIGSKSNIDRYISADEDLIKILQKISYYDRIVFTCEQILQELKNRSWQLKTYVDNEKFLNGV